MVLYNNDSCKSVSTLILLVGLCVFAAASDGKTSPVEDEQNMDAPWPLLPVSSR
ncbi:hypothetical protein DY000_02029555 [Brassica cretica]|uniref:Uncharacterized protein n=1 Tax=Brassica cretica TaxID=69181 RepID=A0ABQ7DX27_BRACR|nr:hypothetical protein DY000_02029555 [Brassica cretica]